MKAVIIGAGPAGLAAAASLQDQGADVTIFDKARDVGSSWRNHYDCLALHTSKGRSTLPGLNYPASVGRYPKRAEVVAYLEDYVAHHDLRPTFDCAVQSVRRHQEGWQVTHAQGTTDCDVVVVATGMNARPHRPVLVGSFGGGMVHAADYKNPSPYQGQKVLVVGFGNSGGDIALDLAHAGVDVTMSVRGPVNILPKQLFGVPITSFGLLSKLIGYKLADTMTAPILRLAVGTPESYGLQSTGKGPGARVIEDGRIPLIDVGTLGAIKAGKIAVTSGIERMDGDTVRFVDGTTDKFDGIICATGYVTDLRPLLGDHCAALDELGRPVASGGDTGAQGLFFCSFRASPDGQLFQTAKEARAIAQLARQQFGLATTG